jgi:hypothetical protein
MVVHSQELVKDLARKADHAVQAGNGITLETVGNAVLIDVETNSKLGVVDSDYLGALGPEGSVLRGKGIR